MKKLFTLTILANSALLTTLILSPTVKSSAIAFSDRQLQSSLTAKQDSQSVTKTENKNQKPEYTGIVKKIDDIAQQITVRIDNLSNGSNGSGVIIAREGNTYYVLTAKHVLCTTEDYANCVSNGNNQIVTPDGKTQAIASETIQIPADWLDLAVVEFKSTETYEVATLADYKLQEQWIFTSGFPNTNSGSEPQRLLTGGKIRNPEETDFVVKDGYSLQGNSQLAGIPVTVEVTDSRDYSITKREQEPVYTTFSPLVYTNISFPGMSGGAILDYQGRVIGINTASEEELAEVDQKGKPIFLKVGYSLGFYISDFIGLAHNTALKKEWLTIETNQVSEITKSNLTTIAEQLLTVQEPSPDDDYVSWVNYGNQLWRSGKDIKKVLAAYEQSLNLKETPQAYYGIGLAYFDLKQYQQAAINFKKATVKEGKPFYWRWLGYSYSFSGNYTEALSAYDIAIDKVNKGQNSQILVFLIERGDILTKLNRHLEAIDSFTEALNLKIHPWAYNNRGVAYSKSKQYDKALADFERALAINPQNKFAHDNIGVTYYELQQYDKAIANFNRSIEIDPQNSSAYSNRGIIYDKLQEQNKALADFTKAIELNPQNARAYNNRGTTYSDLRQYDLGFADFAKAIEINPNYASVYYNRGTNYAELQQYEKAIVDFDRAISLNPQDADYYYNRGFIYTNIGEFQKAIADLNQAVTINPQFGEAYSNRGFIYFNLGELDKALMDYNKAIAVNSNLTDTYFNRGLAYFGLQEYDKAIADYNKTLAANPQDIDAYLNRGNVYAVTKRYDLALADYERVITINPKAIGALNNIGSVAYEQRDISKAIANWQKTLQLAPDMEQTKLGLAVALYRQGETEQAFQLAEQVLSVNPLLGNIEFLKSQYWAEVLLKDTQDFFQQERIQKLVLE